MTSKEEKSVVCEGQWESSKNAWMTGQIWSKYLNKWDMELCLGSQHILPLIENAPCHPEVPTLTNIKVVFLPKNTTTLIQPCDAGITCNLKGKLIAITV